MSDDPTRRCWCVINHPQTPAERAEVAASLNLAREIGDLNAIRLHLLMLTGPCPAWANPDTKEKTAKVDEIMRALANGTSPAEAIDQETLRLFVARQIVCPFRRTVLDVKRAVLLDCGPEVGAQVISADYWDEAASDFLSVVADLGVVPRVLDGRLMRWADRAVDYDDLGVYRDVLNRFAAGDEAFARWCADRWPFGGFDPAHARVVYDQLHRFAEGDAVELGWPWEGLPRGTRGRTVGRPVELFSPSRPVQFIELPDRRRVVVPLGLLLPATDATGKGDETDG
ncbi:hypothetical protein [Actinomadura rayongensis]|uniref:Uncharacterized protein n=1 Tax=Actinomadura rayongensis TaxID=1429076 RepID=A0A6I4WDH8_9ACTN|nr:hypothetical protein [Actinomadura rayongensis]MXQ67721.1 hypothetical protein [Actinomadura rayongensis]